MEGLFFTKNGQCVDLRDVNIIKEEEVEGGMKYRPVVRIDVRKDGESYEFKQANSEEIPTFSLIDFACIPLKKPNKKEEGIKEKRKSKFDLFTRK